MIPDHYLHIILGAVTVLPLGIFLGMLIGLALGKYRSKNRDKMNFDQWKRTPIFKA